MSRPRAPNDHDTPLKCEEPGYDLTAAKLRLHTAIDED
jgi:hypothetical protein